MKLDCKRLEEFRVRRGLNQTELADRAGMSRQWLSVVLLRGSTTPETAVKIADALEVKLTDILKEEP